MSEQNRFRSAITVAAVCWLFISSVFCLRAEEERKTQAAPKRTFFRGAMSPGVKALAPYANEPDEKAILPVGRCRGALLAFDGWLKKVMRPEYVPDDAFVERQIQLYPAKSTGSKEDVAFLSYEFDGKTFRIVQTGGLCARMWIFVRDPVQKEVHGIADAAGRVRSVLDRYISEKIRKQLREFGFQQSDDVYV